jgi:hypothetical protein
MILKINSSNDKLLDILYKNPDTDNGLYCKPLKNGQIIGNVVGKNEYEVVFQDKKYSYCPEDSNVIDYQSYCSPLAVLHVCNELFGHILKSRTEYSGTTIKWLGITQGENVPYFIFYLFIMRTVKSVDDRDQVVEMWRKDLKLNCFQVNYGAF